MAIPYLRYSLSIFILIIGISPMQTARADFVCNNNTTVVYANECGAGGVDHEIMICGNGRVELAEECDDGVDISDNEPNSCRSDCTLYRCGDGVVDNGEQCDDGSENSDLIPDACRTDCAAPRCGDGVRDLYEECDADPEYGCRQCVSCVTPQDDLDIYEDTKLCAGEWQINDNGTAGVVRVLGDNVLLNCNGARLVGIGANTRTGILVAGTGVILRNCDLSGYQTGIKILSTGSALFSNTVCHNYKDIDADKTGNFGVSNQCSRVTNWTEVGTGCSEACPPRPLPTKIAPQVSGKAAEMGQRLGQVTEGASSTSQRAGTGRAAPVLPREPVATPRRQPATTAKESRSTARPPATGAVGAYQFSKNVAKASWSSRAGKVRFGSDRMPVTGMARALPNGQMANGRRMKNLLLTQPDQRTGGFIQGDYPALRLGENLFFRATAGMLKSRVSTAGATFEVLVKAGRRTTSVLKQRVRGAKLVTLNVDLSRWGGKRVQLLLRVSSLEGGVAASPVWINPRLQSGTRKPAARMR